MILTFNVGPSKVYPQVKQFMADAYDSGILSISHRSAAFDAMSRQTIELIHQKLHIPSDYTVMYCGSATESWEILSQDLVQNSSIHFFNGEFGRKWFDYASYIHCNTEGYLFDANTDVDYLFDCIKHTHEMLCFTLNETSTGTQVPVSSIIKAKKLSPNALVAIDTTSCIGGINLPFEHVDIVYGSVQKCFGLPAGLGLLICSPRAIEKAYYLKVKGRYNSLLNMVENIKKYQTNYTPNVLGIYLLGRVLHQMPEILAIHDETIRRAQQWYAFFQEISGFEPFITNEIVRSDTVLTIKASETKIQEIKNAAKSENIELGSGYGELKKSTFRIANFPAITAEEIQILQQFLKHFSR